MRKLPPLLARAGKAAGWFGDGMVFSAAALKLADINVVIGSGMLAYVLRTGRIFSSQESQYFYALLVGSLLTWLVFVQLSLYQSWRLVRPTMMQSRLLIGWSMVLLTLALLSFLSKTGSSFSRLWFLYWAGLGLCGLIGVRIALNRLLRWLHHCGIGMHRITVLGPPETVEQVVNRIQHGSWFGLQLVSMPNEINAGNLDTLPELLQRHDVAEVWLTWPMRDEHLIRESVRQLSSNRVNVRWIPDIFAFKLVHSGMAELAGAPMLELSVRPLSPASHLLKTTVDKLLASAILLLTAPLLLTLAAIVKLSSPGPVIFRQLRHGWDGHPFEVWKFRSMYVHDPVQASPQTSRNDPRVTPFGAFIRRNSLDELPQFFNVLQGRMSIVGPRPHALSHNAQYQDLIPNYLQRHRVKPGITGWAQVNGLRGETDSTEKMRKRVEYDLYYIQHWSLWLDLSIIAQTAASLVFDRDVY